MRAGFLKKPYEFQVTNYQMGVLLVYNSTNTDTLTLDGILDSSWNGAEAGVGAGPGSRGGWMGLYVNKLRGLFCD